MKDQNLMSVHAGGKLVTMEQLQEVELPEATSTYHPIAHYDLAQFVKKTASELLRAEPVKETYALAKDGQRLFGLQVFGEPQVLCTSCKGIGVVGDGVNAMDCPICQGTGWMDKDEYGFGVAFRHSYDKSMAVGIAAGFSVFVCDNLAISGEIHIMRKHTKNAWADIDQVLVHALFRKAPEIREKFAIDVDLFKGHGMDVTEGYRLMGQLVGMNLMGVTQFGVALAEWKRHDHQNRLANAWQLYNACTGALKSSPPHNILERHKGLHDLLKAEL